MQTHNNPNANWELHLAKLAPVLTLVLKKVALFIKLLPELLYCLYNLS